MLSLKSHGRLSILREGPPTCTCYEQRGGYQERNQVEMHEFTVEEMVRDYHVYQTVWEVRIGEVLPCTREPGN